MTTRARSLLLGSPMVTGKQASFCSTWVVALASAFALGGCLSEVEGDEDDEETLSIAAGGWGTPIFSDQFGTTLKPTWKTEGALPIAQCAHITDGELVIKPKKRTDCYIYNDTAFNGNEPGSAYMFSAKVKLSLSNGNHPSFWLRPPRTENIYNEYDIVESYGQTKGSPDRECGHDAVTSTSGKGFYNVQSNMYSSAVPPTGRRDCFTQAQAETALDGNYHVFSMVYAPGQSVAFFMDGVRTASFGPKYAVGSLLVMSLTNLLNEIKDDQGNITGYRDVTGDQPNMRVKWVKVWKKTGVTQAKLGYVADDAEESSGGAPAASCGSDNDCWRAQLGVNAYNFPVITNPNDPRLARIIFDRRFYLNAYPDVLSWAQGKVATQGGNLYDHAQWHWLNYGIPQGRMGAPTFDPGAYMSWNSDVAAAYGATNYLGAINHFITYGRFEGRRSSVFFDVASYKARYGDIAGFANYAALDHFANHGMDEGRQGSADFAPAAYLGNNPDVQNAWGANYYRGGMTHWIGWGRAEGRAGAP
jgi:hypothetical protein